MFKVKSFLSKPINYVPAVFAFFFALFIMPSFARADAISDAIKDFDTSNIMTAGAALIALVIAIVGVRAVIKLVRGGA